MHITITISEMLIKHMEIVSYFNVSYIFKKVISLFGINKFSVVGKLKFKEIHTWKT